MSYEPAPTLRSELDRKVVETLIDATSRVDLGRMPKRELGLIGQTLWSAVSGLASDDVARSCADAAELATAMPMKRHFVGKGTVRTVGWLPDRPGYVVQSRDMNGAVLNTNKRAADVGERETELETLFAALRKAGYTEL